MTHDSAWRRASVIANALGALLAVAAVVFLAVAPVYSSGQTLTEANGLRPLFFLVALGLVAAAPLTVRHRWRRYRGLTALSAVVLTIVVVLGGFSIGRFFAPAAGCAMLALATALLARG